MALGVDHGTAVTKRNKLRQIAEVFGGGYVVCFVSLGATFKMIE